VTIGLLGDDEVVYLNINLYVCSAYS